MVNHMKTTVDLPESLLRDAQEAARSANTTLRALIEDGLRTVLARRRAADDFTLRDASVTGSGVRPELRGASWERIRAEAYGTPQ